MRIHTVRDLGAAIRSRRHALGWTQEELATAAGVARQWIIGTEKGKPTAEVAPVLRTLTALGLAIDLVEAPIAHGGIDLDELLGGPRD